MTIGLQKQYNASDSKAMSQLRDLRIEAYRLADGNLDDLLLRRLNTEYARLLATCMPVGYALVTEHPDRSARVEKPESIAALVLRCTGSPLLGLVAELEKREHQPQPH